MLLGSRKIGQEDWLGWLRACYLDRSSPARLPYSLGALAGHDAEVLAAISACWDLYSEADDAGKQAALQAIRSLLPALQPQCHIFARELIAFSLEWSDRARLWALVAPGLETRRMVTP